MPYYRRRRFFRRKSTKRVNKYTKRKLIKGYLRKKARKGNTIVSKMKTVCKITAADMTNGVKGSFVNPYLTFSGVSGDTGPPSDWTSYENLYDSYRICAIKLKWIPNVNQISFQGSGISGAVPFVNGYMPGFLIADYDALFTESMPTIDEMNQYENCKSLNLYRPWKKYFRVPKYSSNPNGNQIPQVVLGKGNYYDLRSNTDSTGYPSYGRWVFRTETADYTDNNDINEGLNVGTLIVTTYAAFKNRR